MIRYEGQYSATIELTSADQEVWIEIAPGAGSRYELRIVEKELMKPRYEIHGFTTEGVVSGRLPFAPKEPEAEEATRQRAAAVLFAATEQRNPHTLTVNTYEQRLAEAMEAWTRQMARDAEKIDRALRQYYEKHRTYVSEDDDVSVLVDEGFLKKSDLRDRWGNAYRVHWRQAQCWLDSAGPDGRWDTRDDMRRIGQWAKDGRMMFFGEGDALGAVRRGGVAGAIVVNGAVMMEKAMAMPMAAAPTEPEAAGQPPHGQVTVAAQGRLHERHVKLE